MEEQLLGTTLPVLSISLNPGESVIAEAGEFSWMTDSIQMSTGMGGAGGGDRGCAEARGRRLHFVPVQLHRHRQRRDHRVRGEAPGSILGIDVGPQHEYLVHRHGFLAGTAGIEISAGFQQSFSAGIFGGEGFVLQRVAGQGRAWIELAGEMVRYDLAAGQSLRAHPGHVGLFTASVSFQVMRVPGVTNRYFGGDAHHFAVLSGPGAVWLQSMPLPVLAASLAPYLPQAQGDHSATESGVAGGIIGDLLR